MQLFKVRKMEQGDHKGDQTDFLQITEFKVKSKEYKFDNVPCLFNHCNLVFDV